MTVLYTFKIHWLLFITEPFRTNKKIEEKSKPKCIPVTQWQKPCVGVFISNYFDVYFCGEVLYKCGPIKYMIKFCKGILFAFIIETFLWHQKAFIKSLLYLSVLVGDRKC